MRSPELHRQPVNRADALLEAQRQVLEMIVRGHALGDVLAELCLIVEKQAEQSVRAAILLVDDRGKQLYTGAAPSLPPSYCAAIDGIGIAADVGTCAAAAARREMVITKRIATDPAWEPFRHLPLALGLEAAWSLPILSSSGQVLGTFGTYFLESREPHAEERRLVEVLTRTAALAIERAHSDQAQRAAAERHRFLAELAAAAEPLVEGTDVMHITARLLAEHLNVDRCAYAEVDAERIFDIKGDFTRGVSSIVGRWPIAAFGPRCLRDMLAGDPYVADDIECDASLTAEHHAAYRATSIRAVVCVPLHKKGKLTAAMAVHQTAPRSWTPAEVALITQVVDGCWEAIERVRITRSLRESEARYRAMVQASPECVKLVAKDGSLLQVNAAGLDMIEAPDEQSVVGQSVYDLIAVEHREHFRAFNERVCAGQPGSLQFEIIGLRGTRRMMETTAVPLASADGSYDQLAITRDVTAKALSARALADSRARLDYAVRLSGVGFWYCELPFDFLIWDQRVREHFFLTPSERVTIDTFYERMHPDDRATTRSAIDTSIERRSSYDVVYRTVDPSSGAVKWIRALGGATYGSDGSPTHFDGVTVDVTAQKVDQERLRNVLDREREQARLLEKVAHAALTIHAADSVDAVLRVVAEQAKIIIGAQNALASLNVPRELGPGVLSVPLLWRGGANLGIVELSNKEVGEFNETDEAILMQLAQIAAVAIDNARLYDQLRNQDRSKDEFLATLAHELRNPLAPIRTGLSVLQFTQDAARATRVREMMERQLGHLVRMVDDLLDISRITLGKEALKKERIDFRVAVRSALEITRPLVEAGGHRFDVRMPDLPLLLDADPTRLAQMVANLVNNAAKYTPHGGHIQLSAEPAGSMLCVTVSDTGVGIPAEMVPRVFDLFTQVGRSIDRSQGGLGIGLTLVRRLAEMHGGCVEAESAGVGLGSTFTLQLPLASEPSTERELSAKAGRAPQAQVFRIAVVDDNVDGAESLALLLELNGHQTRMAHDGLSALTLAKDFQPHVIFLDIGLPGLNGYEVAKQLRMDQTLPQPMLVALTGWGSEDDRRQAHEAGFDKHLVKPFDPSKLNEIMAAAKPF